MIDDTLNDDMRISIWFLELGAAGASRGYLMIRSWSVTWGFSCYMLCDIGRLVHELT